ncbi:MAG: phage holin family protein [Pseudomonadota bacterium]|nr:phage holin family protein [Pseudomonadota bacterium]
MNTDNVHSSNVHPSPEQRSVGTLLADLSREFTTLLRQEVALAKAEASEKVSQIGSGVGAIAVGGAVLFGGFLVLLDALVYILAQILEPWADRYPWLSYPWLPSLIVAVVVLLIGYSMLKKGQSNLKATNLAPRKTAASLQRDKDLVKEHVR